MKYVKTLLIIIFFLAVEEATAQVLMQSRIAKVGYSGDFMPFQEDGYYSLHFDLESSTRIHYLNNEVGVGFMRNGSDLYYTKFDFKFYPLSAIFNNFRYQGIYLSAGPGLYYEDFQESNSKFGLGIFTTGGVQFMLNNRVSVAFEVEMNLLGNLASHTETYKAPPDNHVFFSNSIKIGYVFNQKK